MVRRLFSVHNYMKTYPAEAVSRHHGRLRVDEYAELKNSKRQINRLEKEEIVRYDKAKQKWQHLTDNYYEVVRQRQNVQIQSPTELYDEYEYFTKVVWLN